MWVTLNTIHDVKLCDTQNGPMIGGVGDGGFRQISKWTHAPPPTTQLYDSPDWTIVAIPTNEPPHAPSNNDPSTNLTSSFFVQAFVRPRGSTPSPSFLSLSFLHAVGAKSFEVTSLLQQATAIATKA